MTLRHTQEQNLLTAKELARFANTTKRTILWYSNKGILKPYKINNKGYRFYKEEQVLEFQTIYLLRKLHFSIDEIKSYLKKNKSLKNMFESKQKLLQRELEDLQTSLSNLSDYYSSLDKSGTLVSPVRKKVDAFDIYYIDREGSYSQIINFQKELLSYFSKLPDDAVLVTLFEEAGYRPKKSKMKIGIVKMNGLKIKERNSDEVKKLKIPSFKALIYIHKGSGNNLSLMWKNLEKWAAKNDLKQNTTLPFYDLEFYHDAIRVGGKVWFEICMPILS